MASEVGIINTVSVILLKIWAGAKNDGVSERHSSCCSWLSIKVKQSLYRPGQALSIPGGWSSQIPWQSAPDGGKVVRPYAAADIQVIQEDRSIIWGVIVSVTVRKIHINLCLILNGYRDKAVWIHRYKNIVNGSKEREIAANLILIQYLNEIFVTQKCQIWYSSK
jgi:hypothetical protein